MTQAISVNAGAANPTAEYGSGDGCCLLLLLLLWVRVVRWRSNCGNVGRSGLAPPLCISLLLSAITVSTHPPPKHPTLTLPDLKAIDPSQATTLLSLVPKKAQAVLSYVAATYDTRSTPPAAVAPSLCHGLKAAPLEDLLLLYGSYGFRPAATLPRVYCCAWIGQNDGLESTDDGRWVRRCGE